MRFRRDGTERHGARGESLDDLFCRLDLLKRNRRAGRLDLEQPAEGHVPLRLVVDDLRVFFVGGVAILLGGMLQFRNGIRRPHMLFTAHAESIFAARVERGGEYGILAIGKAMHTHRLLGNLVDTDAFDIACGAGEIFFDERAV